MTKFVDASDLYDLISPDDRKEIEQEVQAFVLAEDAARVHGDPIRQFNADVVQSGAKVYAEMPNGKRVDLQFDKLPVAA